MKQSRVYTAEAIVLKRRNVGETDRTLTLFTKQYGIVRVLARGVRKVTSRRAPHIEVFNHLIATIHKGQHQDTLTEVAPVETFEQVRHDLKRVGAAYYLCELIDGLLPVEQVHEDVFALLVEALTTLSKVGRERVDVLRARFAAALLTKLGYMASGKKYKDNDIDAYVEELLERRLKTVRLASQLNI